MNAALKKQLVKLADAHQKADEYESGYYYDTKSRKGCSIGCTIVDATKLGVLPKTTPTDSHVRLAVTLGVPELVWRLADIIFEGLPEKDRPAWTPRYLRAIRPNADYANLADRINARLADKLVADAIRDDVKASAKIIAKLYRSRAAGEQIVDADWYAAWQQADAAWQQAYAVWQQAYAARQQADAAWQQADATWQQADATWQQADAVRRRWWKWCADMLCKELAAK